MIIRSPSVSGVLKDSVNGQVIGSMTITSTADKPVTIKRTITDSSGSYQETAVKAPSRVGTYNLTPKFAGTRYATLPAHQQRRRLSSDKRT